MSHFIHYNYIILTLILILNIFIIKNYELLNIFKIYDYPDENRKFHKSKTPIIGGNILFINIIIYLFIDYSVLDLKDQFSLYFVNSLKTFYSFTYVYF